MNTPRISIAMATYNGAKYLREQLDSIATQTLPPYELVICDDGSTDATLDIAEQFAAEAEFPVRIYCNESNLGYADNFFKAASLCQGDWIAFCDQDDVWLENKLKKIAYYLSNIDDLVLITHSAAYVDSSLRSLGKTYPSHKFSITKPLEAKFWFTLFGFTAVFKAVLVREFPSTNRPTDFTSLNKPQSHDLWVYFLANVLGKIVFTPDVLSYYRRHDSSVTGGENAASMAVSLNWMKVFGYKKVDSHYYLDLSRIARQYSLILDDLSRRTNNKLYQSRLIDGKRHTVMLSDVMLRRQKIHDPSSKLKEKLSAFIANGLIRVNNRKLADVTSRTMIKDCLVSVGLLR